MAGRRRASADERAPRAARRGYGRIYYSAFAGAGKGARGGEENTRRRITRVPTVRWRAPQIHLPLASCIKKFIVLFCCVISDVIGPSIG